MSVFYQRLDEYYTQGAREIRAVVRRCWHFAFVGYDVRMFDGQGKLFTEDGNEWLGYVDADKRKLLTSPRMSDGRDGTAPTYEFTLSLVDLPGQSAFEVYTALKADQSLVHNQPLTCWLALLQVNEGLRPNTPLEFFKELTMQSTRFTESVVMEGNSLHKRYTVTLIAKDGNLGRSNVPNGTYSSTVQKERARQLGVAPDKGCDFVLGLADRTFQIP